MRKIFYLLAAVLVALAAYFFVADLWAFFKVTAHHFTFPYDLEQEEGYNLIHAVFLKEGVPIYSPLDQYPYLFTNDYPPVYFILLALLLPFFGHTLLPARLLSFIPVLGCALLVYFFIRQLSEKQENSGQGVIAELSRQVIPLGAAIVFLTNDLIVYWCSLARTDFLSIFFSLLGLYFIRNYPRGFYWAILFFLLSGFTKQLTVAAIFASFIWLPHPARWRFLAILSGLTAAVLLILFVVTGGQFFHHLFFYNMIVGAPEIRYLVFFLATNVFLLPILLAGIKDRNYSLFTIYFFIVFTLKTLQLFKGGAHSNYYIEVFLVMVILVGGGACRLKAALVNGKDGGSLFIPRFKALGALILLLLYLILNTSIYYMETMDTHKRKIGDYLLSLTKRYNVLNEFGTFNVLAGKEPRPEGFGLKELYHAGYLSPDDLYNFCVKNDFRYLIFYEDYKDLPGFDQCVKERYSLSEQLPRYNPVGINMLMYDKKSDIAMHNILPLAGIAYRFISFSQSIVDWLETLLPQRLKSGFKEDSFDREWQIYQRNDFGE